MLAPPELETYNLRLWRCLSGRSRHRNSSFLSTRSCKYLGTKSKDGPCDTAKDGPCRGAWGRCDGVPEMAWCCIRLTSRSTAFIPKDGNYSNTNESGYLAGQAGVLLHMSRLESPLFSLFSSLSFWLLHQPSNYRRPASKVIFSSGPSFAFFPIRQGGPNLHGTYVNRKHLVTRLAVVTTTTWHTKKIRHAHNIVDNVSV